LTSLDQNLAIYRLHSYELMFAQDKDRPAKIAETDAVCKNCADALTQLAKLYPAGEGQQFVAALQTSFDDYVGLVDRIRSKIDKDFDGAMKSLDQEVPAKVNQLEAASQTVGAYCNKVADERTALTVDSFGRVRNSVLGFGSAGVIFA